MGLYVFLSILWNVYLVGIFISFATVVFYLGSAREIANDFKWITSISLMSWVGFSWIAGDIVTLSDFKKKRLKDICD